MTLSSIYEAQLDWVLQTLRRLGVAESELDDAAHELFVIVHRKLSSFDRSRPLRPWMFGIAFRVARDHLRSRRRRELHILSSPDADTAGGLDLEATANARAQLVRIQRVLDSLDHERRAAFVMHDLDGFSAPEIAEVLEIPVNTLYSHIRRARRHVLQQLRDQSEARHESG